MKVGDKLYCHTELISNNSTMLVKGNTYTIISISDRAITILDNNLDRHEFTLLFYPKWFYELKKLRKLKLEKIYETNLR